MDINCIKDDKKLLVSLSGRLDSSTVHDLEARLSEELKNFDELTFDFAGLEYLSSAGLRVILASHKLMSGKMNIINVNETIMDIFDMTGMSTILNISAG